MSKNRIFLGVAAGALLLGMTSAQAADIEPEIAQPGWYVSLFGGATWLNDVETRYDLNYTIDTGTAAGFIVGGAIGTHVTDNLRVELEVAYSENDVESLRYSGPANTGTTYEGDGSFEILTFMGNLWYDIPVTETLSPYLGGGTGVGIVDAKDIIYDDPQATGEVYDSSEVVVAFQLGAGVRWQAFEHLAFDIGYRLRGLTSTTFETSDESNTDHPAESVFSHNLIGGVSVGF